MVNFDYLKNNMTNLTIDSTNLNESTNIIPALISESNDVSQGYLGLGIMLGIFLVLTYTLYRQDGDIRLDILRSIMKASGFASIIGVIMVVSGITTSFVHVMWFITIFIISLLSAYQLKKKSL